MKDITFFVILFVGDIMKILASDFDETIYYPEDREKTLKNIEAIRRFMAEGNLFCIITGRNYTKLKRDLIKYDIPYSYLVCEDGAKIFDSLDYCIHTILLREEEIKQVENILIKNNIDFYLDDGYNETNYYKDCVKIVIRCLDPEERRRIIKLVKDKVNVHIYASTKHVNIIDRDVNKERALKILCYLEDLDINKIYTIGDSDNDYEMLKAFKGVIVSNHSKKLEELGKKEFNTFSDYVDYLIEKDKLLKI